MKKRGQVTLFIILGLLIVLIIALLVYYKENLIESIGEIGGRRVSLPPQVLEIQEYVKGCIKDTGSNGLFVMGLQGGYITPPENSLDTGFSNIGYGYFKGKDFLVSKARMEKEFNDYMNLFLPFCLDFNSFSDFEINKGIVKSNSKINFESVDIIISYPLTVSKDEQSYKLDEGYEVSYDIRLGLIHNISRQIVANLIKNPDEIDLTYLLDTGMDIDILPIDENTFVYSLTDPNSEIDNVTYTFMFANQIWK